MTLPRIAREQAAEIVELVNEAELADLAEVVNADRFQATADRISEQEEVELDDALGRCDPGGPGGTRLEGGEVRGREH